MSNFSGISRPVDKDDRDLIIREDDGQIWDRYGFFPKIKTSLMGAVTVDILFFIFRYKLYFLIE